jgi:hypothetical protein
MTRENNQKLLELKVLKNKFVAYSKVLYFYMFEKQHKQHEDQ